MLQPQRFATPRAHFSKIGFSDGALYYAPNRLEERVKLFQSGFPGLVTYAVKANPDETVLQDMVRFGISAFDVASVCEIALLRKIAPEAALHYNNPVRTVEEITFALDNGVRSFSVDCMSELEKLLALAKTPIEVSVRFTLNLDGAAYHFGSKFGADEDEAVELLQEVAKRGHIPSITFHVGTQTNKKENYRTYMRTAASIAENAGVDIARLNVGGGFPSARGGMEPQYGAFFATIKSSLKYFANPPELVCEPGRALIADSMDYAVKVKSIVLGRWVFLTDGIYGGLSEFNVVSPFPLYSVYAPNGDARHGALSMTKGFGPTCDSLDTFKGTMALPRDTKDGDIMTFHGMGAYINGPNTRFNGYGEWVQVTVDQLSDDVND